MQIAHNHKTTYLYKWFSLLFVHFHLNCSFPICFQLCVFATKHLSKTVKAHLSKKDKEKIIDWQKLKHKK